MTEKADPIAEKLSLWSDSLDRKVAGLFDRCNAWLQGPVQWFGLCFALMAVQAVLALSHVGWQDEWQAMLIAVQSPDFAALLENLRYEGHPPLWYLLLRGVALFVPLQWVLAVTQTAIVLAMQALILWKSPFQRFERLLFAASYFVMFEFGVVSRSLSLGALLTIAFFVARDRRIGWAAIIALPMVDFQFGLISLIALALQWRDKKWWWPGAALWVISAILAAISIIPAPDMISAQEEAPAWFIALVTLIRTSPMLVPIHIVDGNLHWNGGVQPEMLGILVGGLFLLFSIRALAADRFNQKLYELFILATFILSAFIYQLGVRHLTLLPLMLVMFKWREIKLHATALSASFRIWLIVMALGGASWVAIAIDRPFETAPQAARYIEQHHLEDKNWVSWPALHGAVVTGMTGIDFQPLGKGCRSSFTRWNRLDPIDSKTLLRAELNKVAQQQGGFYLLTLFDMKKLSPSLVQPLFSTKMGYGGNYYYLYRVAPGTPETAYRAPPCVPARLPLKP